MPRPHPGDLIVRTCAGAALVYFTIPALTSLPLTATLSAALVFGLTVWKPNIGLIATIALAPAGLLLASPPARVAEFLVWSFLAAWLLGMSWPTSERPRWAPLLLPALLYAICATASWAGYIVGTAAGIEPSFLPFVVARAASREHLLYSSPEPETFTLLPLLAGLALFAAAATIARNRKTVRFAVAAALAGSAAALSVLTLADVVRQWSTMDYGWWFLLRYVRGERFSLHLADLNAAGSQYLLGALAAVVLAMVDRRRRTGWIALAALIAPALWISGSRSASVGALLVGATVIAFVRRGAGPSLPRIRWAVALVAVIGIIVAAALAAQAPEEGTASNALRLRAHFLVTSARMFASAPFLGVGIGHYHERSNEFMTPTLREVYGHENAHNFFAQQFSELGIVGGAVFLWLVVAVLLAGWRHVRRAPDDGATLALLASAAGYLLTCITGHPLLVPEAAIPFWGAFGALAGAAAAPADGAPPADTKLRRVAIAFTLLLALANLGLNLRRYALAAAPPNESGFYALETGAGGQPFVWMTRHGVFYIGPQPGTVTIPVRAPEFLDDSRFELTVEIAGRRAGVFDAPADRWMTIEIPLRQPAAGAFRRVDLRANRSWSPMRDRGDREDDLPRSVMVGETKWVPAGGR